MRERAEAGAVLRLDKVQEAKCGIAVKCERTRHESRLPLLKKDSHLVSPFLIGMTETRTPSAQALYRFRATCEQSAECFCKELKTL